MLEKKHYESFIEVARVAIGGDFGKGYMVGLEWFRFADKGCVLEDPGPDATEEFLAGLWLGKSGRPPVSWRDDEYPPSDFFCAFYSDGQARVAGCAARSLSECEDFLMERKSWCQYLLSAMKAAGPQFLWIVPCTQRLFEAIGDKEVGFADLSPRMVGDSFAFDLPSRGLAESSGCAHCAMLAEKRPSE